MKTINSYRFLWLLLALLLGLPDIGLAATPMVKAGQGFSLALSNSGTVWAWGGTSSLGDATEHSTPVHVEGLSGVISVAAGCVHGLAAKQDGTVWAWGWNEYGTLGDGTTNDHSVPVQTLRLSGVVSVAAGCLHSLALKQDGTVWQWGMLSDYNGLVVPTPVQVTGLSGVVAISDGYVDSLAVKQDGTVWIWGFGLYGNNPANPTPVQVQGLNGVVAVAAGYRHGLAVKQDGTVWRFDTYPYLGTPVQVQGLSGVVAVAAWDYSLAVKQDGTVWYFTPYHLVQVQGLSGMASVAVSEDSVGGLISHILAVKQDGTVWAWGDNYRGQLGDGTYSNISDPHSAQITPMVVVNEEVSGFLDLVPEIPNSVPSDKIPPFLVKANKSGEVNASTFSVELKGGGGRLNPMFITASTADNRPLAFLPASVSAAYNVYVAGLVPSGNALAGWWQLDSSLTWSGLMWPIVDFMRGVALDSQDNNVRLQIFQNADLSQLICSKLYIGYGTDPDEMLRNNRYRDILTVKKPDTPPCQ